MPKIEFSSLDGKNRAVFIDSDLDKPLGLTIDYMNDRLYWVDDYHETVEHIDIATAANRVTIQLGADFAHPKLFGLAVYKVSSCRHPLKDNWLANSPLTNDDLEPNLREILR